MCALIPGAADRSQMVCDRDLVRLHTQGGSLDLLVEPRELEARKAAWRPSEPHYARGYGELFSQRVAQAEEDAISIFWLLRLYGRSRGSIGGCSFFWPYE